MTTGVESARPGASPPTGAGGPRGPLPRLGRAARGALAFGADAVVAAVHAVALFAALAPRFQWMVGLAFAGLLALRAPAAARLERSAALRFAARAALLAYVAAFWRGYAYVVSPADAWAVAALAATPLVLRRGGAAPRCFVLVVAAVSTWLGRDAPVGVAAKLAAAGLVVAADGLLPPRGVLARLGREVTASFVALFGVMVLAASFYYRPDTADLEEIRAQAGVQIVAPRGTGPLTARAQVYAAVPSCDESKVVVVVHKSAQGYHLVDRTTGAIAPLGTIRDPSDDVWFRCGAGEVLVGDWRAGRGLVARASELPGLVGIRAYENLVVGPGPLIESEDGELLWHLDARDMKIRVAESASGRLVAESTRFAFGLAALGGGRAFSAGPGELVEWRVERVVEAPEMRSCGECAGRLVASAVTPLDGGWLAPARWLTPNAWLHYTAAGGDRVFVSSLQESTIEAFARRGSVVGPVARTRLPGGARHVTYAQRRDLVLVSGWSNGVVTVLSGRDLAVLRTIRVGARPRTVSLTADESKALVGTGAGIVELDLMALGGPAR